MNTLDHLLEIEAEAAALVNDAQTEADRRIRENENKNQASYDERIKAEISIQQTRLEKERDIIKIEYQKALDDYKEEISNLNIDTLRFTSLVNQYLV
ncbi:MAG: hypothetical protein FWD13_08085 [Treponema sp.]|nr:hypothetical protein [Treponema sp.]